MDNIKQDLEDAGVDRTEFNELLESCSSGCDTEYLTESVYREESESGSFYDPDHNPFIPEYLVEEGLEAENELDFVEDYRELGAYRFKVVLETPIDYSLKAVYNHYFG